MINTNQLNINDNSKEKIIEDYQNKEAFNFSPEKILKKSKEKNNKNEYYCNLLINIPTQYIQKIDYYELLLSLNILNDNKNYKYYIFHKIIKYIELLKNKEKENNILQYDYLIIKYVQFLYQEKNYFYSYYYLSNKINSNQNEIENLKEKISNKISSIIEEKQKFFEKLEKTELIKINDILKNTKENQNIFCIKETLYVINNLWLNRAIDFIDNILNLDLYKNDSKHKFNQLFDLYEIYISYINLNKKGKAVYPGPINNYYLTDYQDFWNDSSNEYENYLIKNEFSLGKDYCLMKEKDWIIIKEIFDATNEIKRNPDNLEFFKIKAIIFDKRIIKYNKLNLLKQKFIQIGKHSNIKQFKEKILRIVNDSLKNKYKENNNNLSNDDIEMEDNTKELYEGYNKNLKNQNDNGISNNINSYDYMNFDNNLYNHDDTEKIVFYKLSKKNQQLLIEIFTSFINQIPKYESINIEKININDENSLELLFNSFNKSNDILLIEIVGKNSYQFLNQIKKNENNLFQCSICKKFIPLKNRYNCKICHMSFYCNRNCSESLLDKSHIELHKYLNEFINKKFDLNEFLKSHIKTDNFNDGLVGLKNLGNTCFINSSLQCLFNTYDLSKYFLSNYFQEEINKKNKQGYNGIIAEGYAELLKEIKTTINSVMNPIDFIKLFYKNNKSLNLRGQQDAQEFLSILLDSLHEDLNRITNKPYLELEEQKLNENDYDASKRYWDYYKKREDSIIIDLFHGQFKSKIICSKCKKCSITYDPFIFFGVPIPHPNQQIIIKFFFKNKCEYLGINVGIKTNILDLKKKAIELMRINNYKNELSDDELFGIIEIVQVDKYKIIRKIYNNEEVHNFDLLSLYVQNEENLELVLYEKNPDEKFFNIYIYPMLGDECDFSWYPIAFSVIREMTFREIIQEYRTNIMSLYTNLHNDDIIKVGLVHKINESWIYYFANGFDSKKECPLCDTSDNFCLLYQHKSIGQIIETIKKKDKNYGPILFVIGNNNKNVINRKENLKIEKYFNNGLFFLSDCLKLFSEDETLNLDNMWYCNSCKKHRLAKKQIRIFKLPIYLIIQLKKFKNTSGIFSTSSEKKETYIKYPISNLDLSEYIEDKEIKKEKYDLYAVIQHHGEISQGHYTTICNINDKWYLFNDEKCFLINNPVTKDAYLLFYKKKDNKI